MKKVSYFFSRYKLHFAFWGLVIGLYLILQLSSLKNPSFTETLATMVEFIMTTAIIIYINLSFLIPYFLYKRKYFQYAAALIGSVIAYSWLVCFIELNILGFYSEIQDPLLFRHFFISNVVMNTLFIVTTTALKLSKKWYLNRAEMQRLRLEKAEAELQVLRTQINPHFLFNTLNNIYSLILSKENEKAGGMILQLSDIMDYMMHDSKDDAVPLQTEINHIRNYLDLEKIRLTGQDHIDFVSETDTDNYKVAPYILMPFIENGFKHGISNTINNGYIKISLSAAKGILNFRVENSKPASADKVSSKGIGLSNIKRRLQIIYPGRHELEILDNPCTFNVNLVINLHEHPLPNS